MMTEQKYVPIKKVFKHIIANENNFRVIQYQEGYFDRIYILTDGIAFIKKTIYNNFDDGIIVKPEYIFGYMSFIYNPKYIKKIDRTVKNIIDTKISLYDINKHEFNGWKPV